MIYVDLYKILVSLCGYKFLKKAKQRELAEMRSLMIKIMVDDFGLGWTEIKNIIPTIQPNYSLNHASIINAYKSYENYEKSVGRIYLESKAKLKSKMLERYHNNVIKYAGKFDVKTIKELNEQLINKL